jgi:hypothetical protein
MNIHALLSFFMSASDDYGSINIYRAILDSEQIILLKKKLKRKFRKFRKIIIFIYSIRPKCQICCRSPPLLLTTKYGP